MISVPEPSTVNAGVDSKQSPESECTSVPFKVKFLPSRMTVSLSFKEMVKPSVTEEVRV